MAPELLSERDPLHPRQRFRHAWLPDIENGNDAQIFLSEVNELWNHYYTNRVPSPRALPDPRRDTGPFDPGRTMRELDRELAEWERWVADHRALPKLAFPLPKRGTFPGTAATSKEKNPKSRVNPNHLL